MKKCLLLIAFCCGTSLSAAEHEVVIAQMTFSPDRLVIQAGDSVRWRNSEKRTYHTVEFAGERSVASDPLFPGDQYRRVFEQPGEYPYHCGPHPQMKALIQVEPRKLD